MAMMTQVPELDSDRHIKMSIVEFIDGFARVADKISIPVRRIYRINSFIRVSKKTYLKSSKPSLT